MKQSFVYLTDIKTIALNNVNDLFLVPTGFVCHVPLRAPVEFSHTITLIVPNGIVEDFQEFWNFSELTAIEPYLRQYHGNVLAPHIFRIPCAAKPSGTHLIEVNQGCYLLDPSKVDGLRTPRPAPKITSLKEYWDLIYDDIYPAEQQ